MCRDFQAEAEGGKPQKQKATSGKACTRYRFAAAVWNIDVNSRRLSSCIFHALLMYSKCGERRESTVRMLYCVLFLSVVVGMGDGALICAVFMLCTSSNHFIFFDVQTRFFYSTSFPSVLATPSCNFAGDRELGAVEQKNRSLSTIGVNSSTQAAGMISSAKSCVLLVSFELFVGPSLAR